jgi:non-homologous end joining protein Ku
VGEGDDAGVYADLVSLPPNTQYHGADPNSGGGQVFLVLQGTLLHDRQALAAPASIALTRDEAAVTLSAGPDGLQMLALQYPRRA